jgi:enediyne biosynthesis protein E3
VTRAFGLLRKVAFGISLEEATFARRGFRVGEAGAQQRLEQIGDVFLQGYHAALEEDAPEALALRLGAVDAELRGFAFEGAAMGLTLLDHLSPGKEKRLQTFLNGPGAAHIYMAHVGVGWAVARLPWLRRHAEQYLTRLDPLLCWLAVDGYGFHEGYFNWRRAIERQTIPRQLKGYARRVFDQGLGRSLWFVEGADIPGISSTVASFEPERHADLWSGAGLACAYAGGVDQAGIEAMRMAAQAYTPQLAQGAAFAAKARQRANNPAAHTEMACKVLCGLSTEAAALITDVALERVPGDGKEPAYEVWRQRIQAQFGMEAVTA